MKILAFLQNQWFKNPEQARQAFARRPERRNDLIRLYLFMGCLTGRRLEAALGDLVNEIVWEECSKEVGGKSSSYFPADLEHIREAISKHQPDIILAFGSVAGHAIDAEPRPCRVIKGPHPAARQGAVSGLSVVAKELRNAMQA